MKTTEDELMDDARHWKAVADGLRTELAQTQAHLAMRNSELAQARGAVDTLQMAMTAPTQEEIELRKQVSALRKEADAAHAEVVQTQDELGALLHSAEAKLTQTATLVEGARVALQEVCANLVGSIKDVEDPAVAETLRRIADIRSALLSMGRKNV